MCHSRRGMAQYAGCVDEVCRWQLCSGILDHEIPPEWSTATSVQGQIKISNHSSSVYNMSPLQIQLQQEFV